MKSKYNSNSYNVLDKKYSKNRFLGSITNCIYCKAPTTKRKGSTEHILQKCLTTEGNKGFILPKPFVCKSCNQGFSKYDELLKDSNIGAILNLLEAEFQNKDFKKVPTSKNDWIQHQISSKIIGVIRIQDHYQAMLGFIHKGYPYVLTSGPQIARITGTSKEECEFYQKYKLEKAMISDPIKTLFLKKDLKNRNNPIYYYQINKNHYLFPSTAADYYLNNPKAFYEDFNLKNTQSSNILIYDPLQGDNRITKLFSILQLGNKKPILSNENIFQDYYEKVELIASENSETVGFLEKGIAKTAINAFYYYSNHCNTEFYFKYGDKLEQIKSYAISENFNPGFVSEITIMNKQVFSSESLEKNKYFHRIFFKEIVIEDRSTNSELLALSVIICYFTGLELNPYVFSVLLTDLPSRKGIETPLVEIEALLQSREQLKIPFRVHENSRFKVCKSEIKPSLYYAKEITDKDKLVHIASVKR